MRPRRYERCSGDDRQRGQAERVSAAGCPSLKTGVSRQPRHTDTGRIRSRRLARHAARGTHTSTHEVSMSEQPRKSPVHAVIRPHSHSLLEPVRSCFPSYDFIPSLLHETPRGALSRNQIDHSHVCWFHTLSTVVHLIHSLSFYRPRAGGPLIQIPHLVKQMDTLMKLVATVNFPDVV